MSSHHPKSSGEKPDTTIYWCRRCGWRSDKAGGLMTRCCGENLGWIAYHKATETELMEAIIAGRENPARD